LVELEIKCPMQSRPSPQPGIGILSPVRLHLRPGKVFGISVWYFRILNVGFNTGVGPAAKIMSNQEQRPSPGGKRICKCPHQTGKTSFSLQLPNTKVDRNEIDCNLLQIAQSRQMGARRPDVCSDTGLQNVMRGKWREPPRATGIGSESPRIIVGLFSPYFPLFPHLI